MAKNTLIITDNKVMATTIASAFGYTSDDETWIAYEGGDVEIIWTGGNLINLALRRRFNRDLEPEAMSAEEITASYYLAYPRSRDHAIVGMDKERIRFIENALEYCDEVVFMCQPTDEGERLIQAIKLFFDINVKTKTVVLNMMDRDDITCAIERNNYYQHITDVLSANAMRRNLSYDISRLEMTKVGTEEVSPEAMRLFKTIKMYKDLYTQFSTGEERKSAIGGLMDFDSLFNAMATKYDMVVDSLWESLLYLYAKGLITNPMTRIAHCPVEWVTGAGFPDKVIPSELNLQYAASVGAILTTSKIDKNLAGISYDPEDAPDDFIPRTAAVYRFILEQVQCIENNTEFECMEYKPFTDTGTRRIHLNTVYQWYLSQKSIRANGIENSFGRLIYELEVAELIEMSDGIVSLCEDKETV